MNYLRISNFIFCLATPFLLLAQHTNKPYEIDLYGSLNQFKEFKLSEVAEDVEYVKLESHTDGLIAYAGIKHVGDYFLIDDWRKPLMVFTSDGKYLRSIGRFGKGPNEYGSAYSYDISENDQKVYILKRNSKVLLVFSIEGKHLNTIELPHYSNNFCLLNNGNILIETHGNYKAEGCFPLCILNSDGILLSEVKRPDLPVGKRLGFNPIPAFDKMPNGQILIQNFARDTVYQIDEKGTLSPFAILNLGKLKLPDKMYYDMLKFSQGEGILNYIVGPGCRLVGNKIKISHSCQQTTSRVGLFDPKSGELFFFKPSETEGPGFANDLDGGPTFWGHDHDQNFYYQRVNAIDLIDNRDFYASQKAKYPEKQKALLKLIDSLEPDDNPLVMIIHRKKMR